MARSKPRCRPGQRRSERRKRKRWTRRRKAQQLGFSYRTHGGARRGAGRKPMGKRAGVRHSPRERCNRHQPVHCGMSLAEDISNLRHPELFPIVRGAIFSGAEKPGFRMVHFSVQKRHLHLIIEADDARALGRGMQALAIRLARRINAALLRRGAVFTDRYFSRVLRTPGETRAAVCYVLQNHRRHRRQRGKTHNPYDLDVCSSAKRVTGWREVQITLPDDLTPIGRPRCWLLRLGWMGAQEREGEYSGQKKGLLSVHEEPARWRA
jgi:REP-associated tyrosine transposase